MYQLFLVFIFTTTISFAQPNKKTISAADSISIDSTNIEEILVAIAWENYPANEVIQRQVIQAKKEKKLAKLNWTSNLRLFYNFNDQVAQSGPTYNRPIYGLGVGISLGDLITLPTHTRIAKEDVKIAEANVEAQKLYIQAEVLKRYYNYLLTLQLLKVRIQSFEVANSSYQIVTKQFKDGKASLDQVDDSGRLMFKTMEEKLTMETQLKLAKLSLEEILTITLEEVLVFAPSFK